MTNRITQYLEYIFASEANFEKIIFEINNDEDRLEILQIIAKEIIHIKSIREKINFKYIKNINLLNLSKIAHDIVRLLFKEVIEWLSQYTRDTAMVKNYIEEDKVKINLLYNMGINYYFHNQDIFLTAISGTFFNLIEESESFRHIAKIAHDAINGTSEIQSLFLDSNGLQVIHRADQLWIRINLASKAKKRKIFSLNKDLEKYKEIVENLKLRIISIEKAMMLTPQIMKKYTPSMIRDIFTESDPKFLPERRLLTVLPAGEMCYNMEIMCAKAAVGAKTLIARQEFKQIEKRFSKSKINNTPKHLNMKKIEYNHQLPFKIARYKEIASRLENIQDELLENFDDQLLKVKEVMVKNLKKFHIDR